MKRIYKNFTLICFFAVFLFSFLFLVFLPNKVSADLEVKYPVIANNPALTSSTTLPNYVKYVFDFGMYLGFFAVFISLVIAGALWIISAGSASAKAEAKDRAMGALSGLLMLALLYLVVVTLNPVLAVLNFQPLPSSATPEQKAQPAPGVYFYTSGDCSGSATPLTSSSSNLASQNIGSAKIQQDATTGTSYISILYDTVNFQGKCLYIDPTSSCVKIPSFGGSASVLQFDFAPNGDGIYFFRKSFFDKNSGYLKISNSQIARSKILMFNLNQYGFTGSSNSADCNVPNEEQDCTKYDDNGICSQKTCPSLGGENISSMKIGGNYAVLFVYASPSDNPSGPWSSCQIFPLQDDVNKIGPEQIKYENIRNNYGVVPNFALIIPVK